MKTKKVLLIAHNKQGASVEFWGKSKKEARENMAHEYSLKGWKIEYRDEYGNSI